VNVVEGWCHRMGAWPYFDTGVPNARTPQDQGCNCFFPS
jgi:hypothetical protein